MKTNVYTVKDSKAGTYGNPFYAVNDSVATRSFEQASKDKNTTIAQYPGDFALYRIAVFCDESGEIAANSPEFVANAVTNADNE